MKKFNFVHEYSLTRCAHAFFDSVLLVSVKREESRICAVYRHSLYYEFINVRLSSVFELFLKFGLSLPVAPLSALCYISLMF